MSRPGNSVALAAVAGLALYLLSRDSGAPTQVYADGTQEIPQPDVPASAPAPDDPGTVGFDFPSPAADTSSAVDAFLFAIRSAEHNAADVASDDAYITFYGGAKFYDLSDHPTLTGEMPGVPLPAQTCKNAGIASGSCVSTAAGGYQINVPTWNEIRSYGGDTLPDFTPESQDEAARRLLIKTGAMALIEAGDIPGAFAKASKRWASLPGNTAKQGQRSSDYVIGKYNDYLENFA